jgi:hypothetical protein
MLTEPTLITPQSQIHDCETTKGTLSTAVQCEIHTPGVETLLVRIVSRNMCSWAGTLDAGADGAPGSESSQRTAFGGGGWDCQLWTCVRQFPVCENVLVLIKRRSRNLTRLIWLCWRVPRCWPPSQVRCRYCDWRCFKVISTGYGDFFNPLGLPTQQLGLARLWKHRHSSWGVCGSSVCGAAC